MKLTRKQLKKLIETFVVGPSGRAVDMSPTKLDANLDAAFEPYIQKIINHPLVQSRGYAEKLKPLLDSDNIKNKMSAFMMAKSLKIISKAEHDEIREIVGDIKLLDAAKDLRKNPPQDVSIGFPGKKVYRSDPGQKTGKKYAVYQAQRDDPNFEQRLSQRIREIIPDLKTFVEGIYRNYGDPTIADFELIQQVTKAVTQMIKQKYGKIYSAGSIYMDPTIKKILKDDFGINELVYNMSSMREEYAQHLDNTDLNQVVHDILDNIIDDTPVDDVLKELKSQGFDENFYKEAFQDLQGNYVIPGFDPNSYQEIMEYYVHDYLSYEDFQGILGISDGVIYRMI